MAILELENLSRHFRILNRREGLIGMVQDIFSTDYKTIKAVDGITLSINAGETVGYIGPNGAGKSTTIKMMTGILRPTGGTLRVCGRVPHKNRQRNAQNIGVVFGQRSQLWWDLPVIESFRLLREIYQVDAIQYEQQMSLISDLVNLAPLYATPVRNLSLGQRMLCDIVAAFIHNPQVVFLDEPTIGLDVAVKSKIRHIIRALNKRYNTTIILTTHDISDIEALCERTIIIDKGKLIFDGATKRVNQMFGAYRTLKAQVPSDSDLVGRTEQILKDRFESDVTFSVQADEPGWITIIFNQDEVALLSVLSAVMDHLPIQDVQTEEISMEAVIERLYEGALV